MTNQPPTQDRSFEEARDAALIEKRSLWSGFLNASPDDSSCPDTPYEVYTEAFEAGADFGRDWERKRAAGLVRALKKITTFLNRSGVPSPESGIAKEALAAYHSQTAGSSDE